MRRTTIALALLLALSLLASCGEAAKVPDDTAKPDAAAETEAETTSQFVNDALPSDLNFDGKEIRIKVGDYNNAYIDDLYSEKQTGSRLSDAVYGTVMSVQDRLNVSLSYDSETYGWSELATFQNKVIAGIMAADNSFDLLFDATNYTPQMFDGEYFLNLADMKYIDLDMPWYNQTVRENLANDYVHFISGMFSLANVKNSFAIYFNADLYESLGKTENLYDLVDSGAWTLDKFIEIINGSYADLDGNGRSDSADRYGLTFGDTNKYLGFQKAFGVSVFEKTSDGYEFTYDNERGVNVIQKLCSLINENENVLPGLSNSENPEFMISTGGGNFASKLFVEGNALMSCGLIADAAVIIPSITFDYGVLPYPKWDEVQTDYCTSLQRNCFALIPTTVSDADAASAVLEALSSESYRTLVPEYCEVSLKTRYSQDNDMSRMFDIITGSIVYDPAEIYSTLLGAPTTNFRQALIDANPNWASTIAAIKDSLIEQMDKIVE